ncbi:hypothetical protein L6164_018028 [Bauhinia variegata]|uniref:Uncharacterized protein n=1 Tax=Bauhinia variegata TaxID=167791 RepID=A0ACB9N9W8_BAUVA|nr:hypothetical protein L6164_018028 [Bauhinia variegata]
MRRTSVSHSGNPCSYIKSLGITSKESHATATESPSDHRSGGGRSSALSSGPVTGEIEQKTSLSQRISLKLLILVLPER